MANYNGRMGKGFRKILQSNKKSEADARNAQTVPERRSKKGAK